MKRKILVLCVGLMLIIAALAVSASAEVYTGNCGANGDNVTYKLDTETGLLEITGTGEMFDWRSSNSHWSSQTANIKTIIIDDGVTSIGGEAFAYCSNLTTITIPDSVTHIYNCAFEKCISLTKVTIPKNVIVLGDSVFSGCSRLTSINIPEKVERVGSGAFYYCSSLVNIVIPNGVTNIGAVAFYGSINLTSITIPDSITRIGAEVFEGCDLKEIWVVRNSYADEYFSDSEYEPLLKYIGESETILGDPNGDGAINTKDAVLLAQYLAKWDVTIDETAADCNADGKIDIKDAVLLAQYLAKWDVTLG